MNSHNPKRGVGMTLAEATGSLPSLGRRSSNLRRVVDEYSMYNKYRINGLFG